MQKGLVHMQNVLAYADDVLIICTGIRTLKAVIEAIEGWSCLNGMKLNKKKSAVVDFLQDVHEMRSLGPIVSETSRLRRSINIWGCASIRS